MLNPDQIEEIKRMSDEGFKPTHIAKELGISRLTVIDYLSSDKGRSETIESPRSKKRHRPLIPDPSPKLKAKREDAEAVDLEVDIEKRLKELKEIKDENGSAVKAKEDEVRINELTVKELKAKKEIEELRRGEKEEKEKRKRKEMIERVKLSCVPLRIRNKLPSYLLLLTLSEISSALSRVELTGLSEEELKLYALMVRNKVWEDPKYSKIVESAGKQAILQLINSSLYEFYKKSGRISFEDFLAEVFKAMIRDDGGETVKRFIGFNLSMGNRSQMEKVVARLEKSVIEKEVRSYGLSS